MAEKVTVSVDGTRPSAAYSNAITPADRRDFIRCARRGRYLYGTGSFALKLGDARRPRDEVRLGRRGGFRAREDPADGNKRRGVGAEQDRLVTLWPVVQRFDQPGEDVRGPGVQLLDGLTGGAGRVDWLVAGVHRRDERVQKAGRCRPRVILPVGAVPFSRGGSHHPR